MSTFIKNIIGLNITESFEIATGFDFISLTFNRVLILILLYFKSQIRSQYQGDFLILTCFKLNFILKIADLGFDVAQALSVCLSLETVTS